MKYYRITDQEQTWWIEYRTNGMENSSSEKISSIETSNSDALELSATQVALGLPDRLGQEISEGGLLTLCTANSLRLSKQYEQVAESYLRVSDAKDFLAFSFAEETGPAVIDAENATIDIEVEALTVVTALVATFTLSKNAFATVGLSTDQVSGVTENDFTSPVVYTVWSETPMYSKEWTITVTVAS